MFLKRVEEEIGIIIEKKVATGAKPAHAKSQQKSNNLGQVQVAIVVVQAIRKGIVVRISHKTREEENPSQMVIATKTTVRD